MEKVRGMFESGMDSFWLVICNMNIGYVVIISKVDMF